MRHNDFKHYRSLFAEQGAYHFRTAFYPASGKEEDTYKDGADRGGRRIYDPDTGRAGV